MHNLLHSIWSGKVRPGARPADPLPLENGVSRKRTDVIFLFSDTHRKYQTLDASFLLEPGLSLADVLAEEFDIVIEDSAAVVICPTEANRAIGQHSWVPHARRCLEVQRL